MLKHLTAFLTALFVFVAVFVFFERFSSPFFQTCVSEEGGNKSKESSQGGDSRFSAVVSRYIRCTGRFTDAHGVGITAIASLIIAAFTATLWWATTGTLKLARDEFHATHRPKIRIHAIEFIKPDDGGNNIGASVLCFNIGDAPAGKVEARGEILRTVTPAIDIQRPLIKAFEAVLPGQKLRFEIRSNIPGRGLEDAGSRLHFVGWIAYWDDAENRRETGFCFVIDPSKRECWITAQKPEYEYEF